MRTLSGSFSSFFLFLSLFFPSSVVADDTVYSNLLLRIDENSKLIKDIWESSTPMRERSPGQATVWEVKSTESFTVHLTPKEHCQEVWICDSGTLPSKAWDEDRVCENKLVLRPMEGSVEEFLAGSLKPTKRAFPFPFITLKPGRSGSYSYDYAADTRDATGRVPVKKDGTMTIKNSPLIITSSPYCEVRLQVADGRRVNFIHVTDEGKPKGLPIKSYSTGSSKAYNEVLVGTAVEETEVFKKCPFWIPKHRPAEEFKYFRWQQYKIETNLNRCDQDEIKKGTTMASIVLVMDKPEECQGVRVCFGDESGKLCQDPKSSVELMPIYNLFIATDNDEARSIEVPAKWLRNIRFSLDPTNNKMTMSYAFMNEMDGAVHQHMFFDSATLLGNSDFLVSLATSGRCSARLVEDSYYGTEKVPQCMKVTDCNVLTAKKFTPMAGSHKLDGEAKDGTFPVRHSGFIELA